jgi:hypothetical protein
VAAGLLKSSGSGAKIKSNSMPEGGVTPAAHTESDVQYIPVLLLAYIIGVGTYDMIKCFEKNDGSSSFRRMVIESKGSYNSENELRSTYHRIITGYDYLVS